MHPYTTPSCLFKILFSLCLLFSSTSLLFAQQQDQLEILIVASSHQNKSAPEKYRPVIEKLKQYNPDMVFGETMLPEDQKAAIAAGYWNKQNDEKRIAYLRRLQPKPTKNASKKIAKAYAALAKNENFHQTRMNLARDLYLNYDRGNGEYQFFVLETQMKQRFGKGEQETYSKMFGPSDSLFSKGLVRETSEYHKIFFPLVYELKHSQIYAMDCQQYDKDWNQAWGSALKKMQELEKKAKADSTSLEAQTMRSINHFFETGWNEAYANQLNGYAFMNSSAYARMDAAQNFFGGPHFYQAAGFPTEEVKQMIHYWNLRNRGMVDNVVRQARAQGAKKVVVAVGSSHRSWMEDILKTMPGIKLVNYNEI